MGANFKKKCTPSVFLENSEGCHSTKRAKFFCVVKHNTFFVFLTVQRLHKKEGWAISILDIFNFYCYFAVCLFYAETITNKIWTKIWTIS